MTILVHVTIKWPVPLNLKMIFFLAFIFEIERETEYKWGRGREREGDTELEAGSRLGAVSTEPDVGLEPMDLRTVRS